MGIWDVYPGCMGSGVRGYKRLGELPVQYTGFQWNVLS